MDIKHIYSGNPLDRGDVQRRDEDWISDSVGDSKSKFLLFKDQEVLIKDGNDPSLVWTSARDLGTLQSYSQPVFLGILDGISHFAIDVSNSKQGSYDFTVDGKIDIRFSDLRSITDFIDQSDLGIVAQAKSQIDWHRRNRFCGSCSGETVMKRGGQVRECSKCSQLNYARTDPVVIMVIYYGDWCLLGQTKARAAGSNRFSVLAGFVEQGESIEEAVSREVLEESGIRIENVRYHSSQPWPFPSNLMIGCHAEAVTTRILIDNEEMHDIRWFHREDVINALTGDNVSLALPGTIAIAHHLIKGWAENTLN